MTKYRLSDDNYSELIAAESLVEACAMAKESWQLGSWDVKCVVNVRVAELDESGEEAGDVEWVDVAVGDDPEEPACVAADHDWCSPYAVVGGLASNPGVWATGGTTIATLTVCRHCGCYRREVHHGRQRNPGECDTREYHDPDEASLAWVEAGGDE